MNIHSLQFSLDFFYSRLVSSLTSLQKIIAVVATIIFSGLALLVLWRKCFFSVKHLKFHETQTALMERIHESKSTSKLYRQAEKVLKEFNGASLKMVIVAPDKASFGALCNYSIGEIWISSALDVDKAFSLFIFELANMTQAEQFNNIHRACLNGELSRDEYAFEMEKIEHLSCFIHSTAIKYAIEEKGEEWRKYDRYHSIILDPLGHLSTQKNCKHTDHYLQYWDTTIRPVLKNKQETAKDQQNEKKQPAAVAAVDKALNPALYDHLMERVHSAQATSKLYRQAENVLKDFNGASLRILIVNPDKSTFPALCDSFKGEIWIKSSLSFDEAFSYFILMLANMTQAAKYSKIHKAGLNKELSREDYAFEMEKIGHLSTYIHTTTIKLAIAEKGEEWRKYDQYHLNVLNPAGHTAHQKTSGIRDYYLKHWDTIQPNH